MSLCANYDVAQIQQQLVAINNTLNRQGPCRTPSKSLRTLTSLKDLTEIYSDIRFWNLRAEMRNAKVHHATRALSAMRSVEPGPNARIPANQLIPNFPATPDDVPQMTGTLPSSTLSFSRLAN